MSLDASYLTRWAMAFALTQAIEIPIYLRVLRVRPLVAFGASAITHPIFWFLIAPSWASLYVALGLEWNDPLYNAALYLAGESVAFFGEAAYFRALGVERALIGAVLANLASLAIGSLLQWLVGWP